MLGSPDNRQSKRACIRRYITPLQFKLRKTGEGENVEKEMERFIVQSECGRRKSDRGTINPQRGYQVLESIYTYIVQYMDGYMHINFIQSDTRTVTLYQHLQVLATHTCMMLYILFIQQFWIWNDFPYKRVKELTRVGRTLKPTFTSQEYGPLGALASMA